jgi:hypothetical protein
MKYLWEILKRAKPSYTLIPLPLKEGGRGIVGIKLAYQSLPDHY